jgi:hypothetical protein
MAKMVWAEGGDKMFDWLVPEPELRKNGPALQHCP